MKTSSKSFSLSLLVLAILLVGSYYFYLKQGSAYQPVSNTQISETKTETYSDPKNGFEFDYPSDEKVSLLSESGAFPNDVGQKIISIKVENTSTFSNISCIEGVDTRCSTIDAGGHKVVTQFQMTGNVIASTYLSGAKSLLFSLSCDSLSTGMTGTNDYCVISDQREEAFEKSLSSFRLTN